jgi:hypothetical protein
MSRRPPSPSRTRSRQVSLHGLRGLTSIGSVPYGPYMSVSRLRIAWLRSAPQSEVSPAPPEQIVRRILASAVSVGMSLVMATPAQASDSLIEARLRTVRLSANGSVQVSFEYRCPGHDYRAVGSPATLLTVYQIEESGHQVYDQKSFRTAVVCDGTMQTLLRRFRPPEGEAFVPELLLTVELNLTVRSDSDLYPGRLSTGEIDTFSLSAQGGTTLAADIHIEQVRLNDRGKLVVSVSYQCPTGWFVDVEDDSDWADISGGQNKPGTHDVTIWEPLGDDIECDGSSHTIVKRVTDQQHEGFSSAIPIQLEAKMILDEVGSQRWTHSSEILTVLVA